MTTDPFAPPLVKQLNLRDGMRVWFDGMPESVADEIDEYALDLHFVADPAAGIDAAHLFVTDRVVLEQKLGSLHRQIAPDGQIWVSWPSAAANQPTDITEDAIRAIARSLGLVATKACTVDEAWAGLKLVIRKDLR